MITSTRIRRWTLILAMSLLPIQTGCETTDARARYDGTASLSSDRPKAVDEMLDEISPQRLLDAVEHLARFGTRHTLSETESATHGIGAARRWILEEMASYAHPDADRPVLTAILDPHTYGPDRRRVPEQTQIVNVVATLPGTMPEAAHRRYYVIGHYDSRAGDPLDAESDAPGANDDASGTALVMELARVMASRNYDATIVFMATAGEEQGLLGARLHAEQARAQNHDIRAVLSNDIIGDPRAPDGRVLDQFIRVFSQAVPRQLSERDISNLRMLGAENDSDSRQLARFIAETAARHDLPVRPMLVNRTDRFLRGGDHTAFNDYDYPGVRFTVVEENYDRQHQDVRIENGINYGDVAEYIDAKYLANVAKINAAALAHLANAPSTPAEARIITAQLANDTTIRWESSPEPDVTGYEVVWRLTTDHTWQNVHDCGMTNEVTLPVSKDNYFFGVRSYDAEGYRSPVAFCTAAAR